MRRLLISLVFASLVSLACAPLAPPTQPPTPTPDFASTVQAQTAATLAARPSPTTMPTPTPTPTPIPTPTRPPTPTPIPFADLWGIEKWRVYTVAELEGSGTWKSPHAYIILKGCRLKINTGLVTGTGQYLFSVDGKFSSHHYLAKVQGDTTTNIQQGKCYEMAVKYYSIKQTCLHKSYYPSIGGGCPSGAREQMLPTFEFVSRADIKNARMLNYRP